MMNYKNYCKVHKSQMYAISLTQTCVMGLWSIFITLPLSILNFLHHKNDFELFTSQKHR